jgi:hypothetical protein
MSELKRVMEILFKTELSSQKIELGLIDDVRKKITLIDDLSQKMDVNLKKHQANKKLYDDSLKSMTDSKNQYYNNTKDIVSISKKIVDSAKELGIDVETIKEYSTLKDSIKSGNKITDVIEELES